MFLSKRVFLSALFSLFVAVSATAQWNVPNPVVKYTESAKGLSIEQAHGVLRIEVEADDLLHVTYEPLNSTAPVRKSDHVIVKSDWSGTKFSVKSDKETLTIATAKIKAIITLATGELTYKNISDELLTQDSYRSLTPTEVNGEKTLRSEVFFAIYGSHEGLYGLGQHQAGVWNYRGEEVDLSQENTNITIPLMVSTNGYGIFWNNPAPSKMNNRFVHSVYWSSSVADRVDYYFIYGPEADGIIGRYRELTGEAPLFGRWAYGFWQCKNKYTSQAELENISSEYRARHIPVDNIVQDWFWWRTMGEMTWNQNYPDPDKLINDLHAKHFHLMVSIWPYFRPGTPVYDQFDKNGWFIDKTKTAGFHPLGQAPYDATNPEAAKTYWANAKNALFDKGVDAWWLDTDEPETEGRETNILLTNKLSLDPGSASGARYANAFPLFHTGNVSSGQREASDKKRVFILSRSAYAGAQRYGVTAWSGDVLSDFTSFERQISAGLNYAISGMPYWTTDIGGFISGGNLKDPNFRELFVRWFEFGAFSPVFRVHGTRVPDENELWSYGPEAEKTLVSYDKLRYRLLPYIYSSAWQVTSQHGTIMRPLVMDWRTDVTAQNISDEYLFGPALLVAPVHKLGATSREVYLPKATWYDFWSGEKIEGGKTMQVSAPIEKLPIFVKAGSIVPFGPEMEWATEKAADPIELRVYPGANGSFTLYEDENDGYAYEKGAYATITFDWDDAAQALNIGARKGEFPGMLKTHTFKIVLPGGREKSVEYSGQKLVVKL